MTEDRGQDAVDHLQSAVLELIAAARAVLDVAEEAVREPLAWREWVTVAARAGAKAAATASSNVTAADAEGNSAAPRPSGVEHIRVS